MKFPIRYSWSFAVLTLLAGTAMTCLDSPEAAESGPAEHAANEQKSGRRRRSARWGRSRSAKIRNSLSESTETRASGTERRE